jgi:hypothetical protein
MLSLYFSGTKKIKKDGEDRGPGEAPAKGRNAARRQGGMEGDWEGEALEDEVPAGRAFGGEAYGRGGSAKRPQPRPGPAGRGRGAYRAIRGKSRLDKGGLRLFRKGGKPAPPGKTRASRPERRLWPRVFTFPATQSGAGPPLLERKGRKV